MHWLRVVSVIFTVTKWLWVIFCVRKLGAPAYSCACVILIAIPFWEFPLVYLKLKSPSNCLQLINGGCNWCASFNTPHLMLPWFVAAIRWAWCEMSVALANAFRHRTDNRLHFKYFTCVCRQTIVVVLLTDMQPNPNMNYVFWLSAAVVIIKRTFPNL